LPTAPGSQFWRRAGNVGAKGAIDNATWSGGMPGGVSLGGYAPPRGMSVFTVEPPLNLNSADYPTAQDRVMQANRKIELQNTPTPSEPCCSVCNDL
jgi:hypothetical protein